MTSRLASRVAWLLLVASGVLVVAAFLLSQANVAVDISATEGPDTQPAGEVECSINPADAVLNDNDDGPGGEHTREFYDEVRDECYAANQDRFDVAVGLGITAGVVLVAAFFLCLWSVSQPTARRTAEESV